MAEAWVQLNCLACENRWSDNPANLPAPGEQYQCPSCGEYANVSEFLLTKQDLETVRGLQGGQER